MAASSVEELTIDRLCSMSGTREECMEMLKQNGKIGSFLIRKSVSVANANALSVLVDPASPDGIYSYLLTKSTDGKIGLTLSKESQSSKQAWRFFDSLESLIECCSGPNSPLKVALTHMVYDAPYVDMKQYRTSHEEDDYVVNDNNSRKVKQESFEGNEAREVLEHLKCSICKDFAVNAVETSCCYQLYCEKCYPKSFDHLCIICGKPSHVQIAGISRKMIGNLPTVCSHNGCNTTIRRSELSNHEEKCDYRIKYCTFNGCHHACRKMEMMQHISTMHAEEAMARLEALSI